MLFILFSIAAVFSQTCSASSTASCAAGGASVWGRFTLSGINATFASTIEEGPHHVCAPTTTSACLSGVAGPAGADACAGRLTGIVDRRARLALLPKPICGCKFNGNLPDDYKRWQQPDQFAARHESQLRSSNTGCGVMCCLSVHNIVSFLS